mmetsp:Transcript_33994/g.52300  ORF Transcript_33994/g.52300 Transcript_33994/m.52300 type:complete len:125 (+) Transcript_33994:32-406(+)
MVIATHVKQVLGHPASLKQRLREDPKLVLKAPEVLIPPTSKKTSNLAGSEGLEELSYGELEDCFQDLDLDTLLEQDLDPQPPTKKKQQVESIASNFEKSEKSGCNITKLDADFSFGSEILKQVT